jgi:predicted nucleic acid-binding protein
MSISVITLAELLVQPIQLSDLQTARSYELALTRMPGLRLVDIDRSLASMAAGLRAHHNIQMADAIQVAATIASGATAFVTNDLRLRRLVEIDVLMLDDFV